MAKKRNDRTIFTPRIATTDLAVDGEKLTYWKQILPEDVIQYTDDSGHTRMINFDKNYHEDVIQAFREKAVDQTCFQLANSQNGHGRDFDPERQRAAVLDMAKFDDLPADVKAKAAQTSGDRARGVWAKMRFFNKKAAKSVHDNPDLGVSARVRENFTRADGKFIKRAVIHVLGTIDPRVTGMSAWQAADLSYDPSDGYVLDLSESHYEGKAMATKEKNRPASIPTEDEIEAMTDEELATFLRESNVLLDDDSAGASNSADDENEDDDDADDGDEDEDGDDGSADADTDTGNGDQENQGASLSNSARQAIDLANTQAAEARQAALRALQAQAKAEFREYRTGLIAAGVRPADIDMCEPILARADEMVIDLSNGGEADLNVTAIVKRLLEAHKGDIDMSVEQGHSGTLDFTNADDDPDREMLDAWDAQD